eukprot:g20371.t1
MITFWGLVFIYGMITLEPGDVPCYMLLEQVQVPRVIGKAGAIIKELRQELRSWFAFAQDTAWEEVMEAFRSKRSGSEVEPSPPVPLQRLPTLNSTGSEIELEARKAREVEQRDLEVQKEKERKKQLREAAAREQQDSVN